MYVQHLAGIGHLQRTIALARAFRKENIEVKIVSGGKPVKIFEQDPIYQLPPAFCDPLDFTTLFDNDGIEVSEKWKRQRCKQLLDIFKSTRPDVLIIETFPFGRRQFQFELLPLLEASSNAKTKTVCSIRDVLQTRTYKKQQQTVDLVNEYFDEVWVHGDPSIIDLSVSFPLIHSIQEKVIYTGYVSKHRSTSSVRNQPFDQVIVSCGGSVAGKRTIESIVNLAAEESRDLHWLFLLGEGFDSAIVRTLKQRLGKHGSINSMSEDYNDLLSSSKLSISQFGYNTALDIVQAKIPAVVVPFEGKDETEQLTRAKYFEELGRLVMVRESELSVSSLSSAVEKALTLNCDPIKIDLNGTRRCTDIVLGKSKGL